MTPDEEVEATSLASKLTVEDNVLLVKAERPVPPVSEEIEKLVAERIYGTFTRQVVLGDNLETDNIEAEYAAGVLRLRIPIAPHAKPRRIPIAEKRDKAEIING